MTIPHRTSAVAALVISAILHAALLGLAMRVSLPGDGPSDLIRIALVGGGGGGGGAPAASSDGGAGPAPPSAVGEPAPPRPPASPDRKRPRVATRKRDPAAPQHASALHPRSLVSKPSAPRDWTFPGTVDQPPSNAPESGPGGGSGAGTGGGSGGGAGTGSGSGSGTGSGPGSGGAGLRAYCLSCPEPQYPRIARARGWQGVVDVDLVIRPDGTVDRAAVAQSSGYPALDDAALTVARRSRFQLADAAPAGVRGRIAYGFRLTSGRP